MKLDLLTPTVFNYVKQRMMGRTKDSIDSMLGRNEQVLVYGDMSDSCYFDFFWSGEDESKDVGFEGSIRSNEFKVTQYTLCDYGSPVLTIDLSELSSTIGEDEFFQLSLVRDIGTLTIEQLRAILEVHEYLDSNKVDWGIK